MQMRLMQSFLIMNHYKSLVVLKLPQHKVQLNYFNTYLKKGFINLASILLCIVYREGSSLLPSNITIRKLQENEFDIFADIYVRGFNMPSFTKDSVRQNNEILYNEPGWHFFIAEVQNIPAGIGVLYINKGVASLAASATLPEFQRKGCHTALIQNELRQLLNPIVL